MQKVQVYLFWSIEESPYGRNNLLETRKGLILGRDLNFR